MTCRFAAGKNLQNFHSVPTFLKIELRLGCIGLWKMWPHTLYPLYIAHICPQCKAAGPKIWDPPLRPCIASKPPTQILFEPISHHQQVHCTSRYLQREAFLQPNLLLLVDNNERALSTHCEFFSLTLSQINSPLLLQWMCKYLMESPVCPCLHCYFACAWTALPFHTQAQLKRDFLHFPTKLQVWSVLLGYKNVIHGT